MHSLVSALGIPGTVATPGGRNVDDIHWHHAASRDWPDGPASIRSDRAGNTDLKTAPRRETH
jgi:hypothetical protein